MVSGFTKFKERFQGFEKQYVIIGGTACDLIMENEELPFRATKDVDIVLIVESLKGGVWKNVGGMKKKEDMKLNKQQRKGYGFTFLSSEK